MYRLASLEEANVALGRDQLKHHAIEQVRRCVQCLKKMLLSALILICFIQSRGCSLFSTSHSEHSVLRLAIVLGRRGLVYRESSIGFLELNNFHHYQHL